MLLETSPSHLRRKKEITKRKHLQTLIYFLTNQNENEGSCCSLACTLFVRVGHQIENNENPMNIKAKCIVTANCKISFERKQENVRRARVGHVAGGSVFCCQGVCISQHSQCQHTYKQILMQPCSPTPHVLSSMNLPSLPISPFPSLSHTVLFLYLQRGFQSAE